MTVYAASLLSNDYSGMLEYVLRTRQRTAHDGIERTLFVCLEEASDPRRQRVVRDRLVNWLYPGGLDVPLPPNEVEGPGGHGTTYDATARDRLLGLIHRLDREVLGDTMKAINALWNCSEAH